MVKAEALICQQCGGAIDRRTMKCPYCDTQYERKYDGATMHFMVERPGVHRIRAQAIIHDEIAARNPEIAAKRVEEQLRRGIADGLLDYMKCEATYDPRRMARIIRGEVRVLDSTHSDWE